MTVRMRWYWLLLQLAAVATGIWSGARIFDALT